MRRVLFLAYHFPPIGGAPVRRNASFARYLRGFDYEPIVVTGPGTPSYRWTPLDPTLSLDGVNIQRIANREPPRSEAWQARSERWLLTPSPWRRWWEANAVPLASEVGADADLVHASLAPYGSANAALTVARALGKPLVVDLEDPWALDEMLVYPSGLHRRIELHHMRRVLAAASAVIMNTPEAALRVREFPELIGTPVVSIPNGFDAEDFEGPASPHDGKKFRIVHTGSLHTDLALRQRRFPLARRLLGGAVAGVDFLTRSHVHLLDAVERLLAQDPELRGVIEVHLAGVLTEADQAVVANFPYVRVHGFLPHVETIELVRSADLLFLPMHDLPVGRRVAIVPCKTYEYGASGRPILAAVPDGDARDLLADLGTTSLCRPADVVAMADAIAAEVERWRAGVSGGGSRPDGFRQYEWRHLVGELSGVFGSVLGDARRETAVATVA
jgi:glycosyltransferase involved in cell wall biosynthesis